MSARLGHGLLRNILLLHGLCQHILPVSSVQPHKIDGIRQADTVAFHSSAVLSGNDEQDREDKALSQDKHGTSVASMKQIFVLCVVMYGTISLAWIFQSRLPKDGSARLHLYVLLLCTTWASMSIGMQVLNKTLVTKLQAPALISMIQMWIAVFALSVPSYKRFFEVSRLQLALWLVVPLFFASMLCTSFYTYEYISLSLYTVIRNLTPLVVLPIERAVMPVETRPKLSFWVVAAILLMLAGAIMYAGGIKDISVVGVVFAIANMLLAVCDRLLQRRLLTTECKGLPSAVCTIMNNAIGSLPALLLALLTHQIADVNKPAHRENWEDPRVWLLLVLSGLIGIGICYLGFECQRVISATSFFVLQNVSKVAVVVCGILFFGDPVKSPLATAGLLLSLGGSFVYGKAQMMLQEKPAEKNEGR